MGEGQTIQWLADKRTNGQTMTYNTIHIKLRNDNGKKVEIFSVVEILYICKIKTKTTTGRVGVYKQIAGL
jgi:hypothetical protein